MPDHLGDDMRKVKVEEKEKDEPEIKGKSLLCYFFVKSSNVNFFLFQ
jgi:hypothetical protein